MGEVKRAMISQPMGGKSEKEIVETRDRAIYKLKQRGFEVVNTLFADEFYSNENIIKRGVRQIPLMYLAKSLENMSLCDTVFFVKGWQRARGCRIEHTAALSYGLDVIYEEDIYE